PSLPRLTQLRPGSHVGRVQLARVPGEEVAGAPAAVAHRVQRLAPPRRGQAVEVQGALEVIDLVLQRAGEHAALVLDDHLGAVEIGAGHACPAMAGGGEALPGHGQAALERLLVQHDPAEALEHRVQHHAAAQGAARIGAGVHEQTPPGADLRCRETGAGGRVIGLEHVRHQGAELVGDLAYPTGALGEGLVADDGDRADGHAGGSPVLLGPEGSSGVDAGALVMRCRSGGLTASRLRASTIHSPRGRCSACPLRADCATARPSSSACAASAARKSRVWVAWGSRSRWCQASRPLAICRARRNSASRAAPKITTMFASHMRIRIAISPLRAVRISAKRVAYTRSCPATRAVPNSTSTLRVEPSVITR